MTVKEPSEIATGPVSPRPSPSSTDAWGRLAALARDGGERAMADLFAADPGRAERYSLHCGDLFLDYAKNRVDDAVLAALVQLAEEMDLPAGIRALFAGEPLNVSEGRPALHVALRGSDRVAGAAGESLRTAVAAELARARDLAARVRAGTWRGVTGRAVSDVINIGIGGSDMGPRMLYHALRQYADPGIRCHFIANVDGAEIRSLLAGLDPETTLVIVASKSFTTHETRLNAGTTRDWFERTLGLPRAEVMGHFVAITENFAEARAFGIADQQLFRMWDWVGGRYSLWSSIGLAAMISIGPEAFGELLAGAAEMDAHFLSAPLARNMPVILALLGIWYRNFLGAEAQAVVPYCERLGYFIGHLQQLDMESSGKSVSVDGEPLDYPTGTLVFGQTGTNGQHSFFQLIHQGTHLIPVDFIGVVDDPLSDPVHHQALLSHMLAQGAALMRGGDDPTLPPERRHPGNRPSNVLLLKGLTPRNLGELIALYEHKVFAQGWLWNINSFDQWGVELGKAIAGQLLAPGGDGLASIDPSTRRLLDIIQGSA